MSKISSTTGYLPILRFFYYIMRSAQRKTDEIDTAIPVLHQ